MSYILKLAVHVGLVFFAFVLAYALRRGLGPEWWLTDPQALLVLSWAVGYAVIAGGFELIFRTERSAWRFSSARDVIRLVQSTALTALTFLALIFVTNRAISLPRSTLVLSWVLSLFALVSVRLLWRAAFDPSLVRSLMFGWRKGAADTQRLILVGEVGAAEAYLRRHAADANVEYVPTSIIAKHAGLVGQLVQGVPVVGVLADLDDLLNDYKLSGRRAAAILFLDDPILELRISTELIGRLRADGWLMLRQPKLTEVSNGDGRLREIALEEFLPREPVTLDTASIRSLVVGKRVLVTGAGGSIGSEICRQLVAFGCAHISLVDHSEFLLFEIDRELSSGASGPTSRAYLCNVRDAERVRAIFEAERPDIVFHAAALKHVTLVENNPAEGVLTNVQGTRNVAEAALHCAASQMVLISTDKAVNPTSVMGATKRIAESVLPVSAKTAFCVVRFGNVLGSAGSVVPIFRDQIERGGPVTITDEEVERFFMTIPEAVQLVLQAAVLSDGNRSSGLRKYVLEMGSPVKIIDLARRMIELSGRVAGRDIEIEIIGLRPGEKLSEELVDDGETARPCVAGISEIEDGSKDARLPAEQLGRLLTMAAAGKDPGRLTQEVGKAIAVLRKPPAEQRRRTGQAAPARRKLAKEVGVSGGPDPRKLAT